jgi:hypothetical protein
MDRPKVNDTSKPSSTPTLPKENPFSEETEAGLVEYLRGRLAGDIPDPAEDDAASGE